MLEGLTVEDVMTHLVVTFRPSDPTYFVIHKLMRNRISGAPVTDNGKLVGIISESDISRGAVSRFSGPKGEMVLQESVGEIMTKQVAVARPGDSVASAAALIDRRGVRRLPVVDDDGYVVGVIARADIVRALATHLPAAAATA